MADEEIKPINLEVLGRFGIGAESNTLYFDGERIHTDATVRLTDRQARFAGAAAVGALIGGLSSFIYGSVYVTDTLFRTKPPVRAEISTPEKAPFPVTIPLQNGPTSAAPATPTPKPAPEPVPAPPPATPPPASR